jgi:uncharacterized membrane protein
MTQLQVFGRKVRRSGGAYRSGGRAVTVSTEDSSEAPPDGAGDAAAVVQNPPEGAARHWWKNRPWLGLFTVVVLGWIAAFVVPNYIALDPSKTRVVLRADIWFHYPLLIVHIASSSIALVTGCLQMSAQLRRRSARTHRVLGRLYLFAGAMPASLTALTLIAIDLRASLADAGLSIFVGNSAWAILWIVTSLRAYQLARLRRFADHRRVMIYSFALATAILWTRPFAVIAFTVPGFDPRWFAENVGWVPWVLNLTIAQLWLNRTIRRPFQVRSERVAASGESTAMSARADDLRAATGRYEKITSLR